MDARIPSPLFSYLPGPLKIDLNDVDTFWHYLYDNLEKSFAIKDWKNISTILEDTIYLTNLPSFRMYPDVFEKFIKLLYEVLTIYPLEHYIGQISVLNFLDNIIQYNKRAKNLVLPWKPIYKIIRFLFCSDPILSIVKCYEMFKVVSHLLPRLAVYFPVECVDEMVAKFIPKIAPRGVNTTIFLEIFANMVPVKGGAYKKYIHFLDSEAKTMASYTREASLFFLYSRIFRGNIMDDFSEQLPIIFHCVETILLVQVASPYFIIDHLEENHLYFTPTVKSSSCLALCVFSLLFSPSTQKEALRRFQIVINSAKMLYHPSGGPRYDTEFDHFLDSIMNNIRRALKLMSRSEPEMDPKARPSPEVLHQIIKPIVDIRLLALRNQSDYELIDTIEIIRIETYLDPTQTIRYFDFAMECMQLIDVESVASKGWAVMTALIVEVGTSKLIQDNFENIFELATQSLYIVELQNSLSRFFYAVFCTVAFNKERSIPGLDVDYARLSELFVIAILDVSRRLPALNGKVSLVNTILLSSIKMSLQLLYSNAERSVFERHLPIIIESICDPSIAHAIFLLNNLYYFYCFYASPKESEQVVNTIKQQLEEHPHDVVIMRFLMYIYAFTDSVRSKSIEEIRSCIEYLQRFTKCDNRKLRKFAWRAISYALYPNQSPLIKIELKDKSLPACSQGKIKDFNIEWCHTLEPSELAMEVYQPIFDVLLNSKDHHEIYEVLKISSLSIHMTINHIYEVSEGDISSTSPILRNSFLYIKEFVKPHVPIKEKLIECLNRILTDFKENQLIIGKIISLSDALFSPLMQFTRNPDDTLMNVSRKLWWPIDRDSKTLNQGSLMTKLQLVYNIRRQQFLVPITPDITTFFRKLVDLGLSKYKSIRKYVCTFISLVIDIYIPLFIPMVGDIINRFNELPYNELFDFLTFHGVLVSLIVNEEMMVKTLINLATEIEIDEAETLARLQQFLSITCLSMYTPGCPRDDNPDTIQMLQEIENIIENKTRDDRTFHIILMHVICYTMKKTLHIPKKIYQYIIKMTLSRDNEITIYAICALTVLLRRRVNLKKTKIPCDKKPKLEEFQRLINSCKVTVPNEPIFKQTKLVEKENKKEESFSKEDAKLLAELESLVDENERQSTDEVRQSYDEVNQSYDEEVNPEITKVLNNLDNISVDWKPPVNVNLIENHSNGWHLYADHITIVEPIFEEDKELLEAIPTLIKVTVDGSDANVNESMQEFWRAVAQVLGPVTIDPIKESFDYYLSRPLTDTIIVPLTEVLIGYFDAISNWKTEDQTQFYQKIVIPFLAISAFNPLITNTIESMFTTVTTGVAANQLTPIIQFLVDHISSSPECSIPQKSTIVQLNTIVYTIPMFFFTSFDILYEKIIKNFFADMMSYPTNSVDEIICIFLGMIESTCIPADSPLFSEELPKKRVFLMSEFEKSFFKNDPTKKTFHYILCSFLSYSSIASLDAVSAILPVILRQLTIILKAINTSDLSIEEILVNTIMDYLMHPLFSYNPNRMHEFIQLLFSHFTEIAPPMQLKLLKSLQVMFRVNLPNIPPDHFIAYYDIVEKFANNCTNENVKMKAVRTLGYLLIHIDKPTESMSQLQAAAILLNQYIFDDIPDYVIKAFDIMADTIDNLPRQRTLFYQTVVTKFWQNHSDYLLPSIEEQLDKYRMLVSPSYIS